MLPDTIRNIIAVGVGSFIGGIARYMVSLAMKGISKGFPWATVLVNLLGCLIIGLVLVDGVFLLESHWLHLDIISDVNLDQ